MKMQLVSVTPYKSNWRGAGSRLAKCVLTSGIVSTLTYAVLTLTAGEIQAQQLNGTTSWIGNSFGGANNKWVQVSVDEIEVSSDGTVYTASEWDESGRCTAAYKDGDLTANMFKQYDGAGGHSAWGWGTANAAVAIDDTRVFLVNTEGALLRFNRSDQKYIDTTNVGKAVGATVRGGLLVIIRDNGDIQVRNSGDLALQRTFNVPGARDVAIDSSSTLWILANKQILRYGTNGSAMSQKITSVIDPASVSIDNTGRLVVCENGPHRQVLFYKISTTTPSLASRFGTEGGIGAGTPGAVSPLKFWKLAGAGTDSSGNVYVALSGGGWDGTALRKFTSSGTLVWEVRADHFLDNIVVDPSSDGTVLYGSEERYEMDFTAAPGRQDKLVGYTYDQLANPDDPRTKDASYHASFARRLNGKLLLYMTNMYADAVHVYGFRTDKGEFAQLDYTYNRVIGGWGVYPDSKGDIWEAGETKIRRTPFNGFDAAGKPLYGAAETVTPPSTFSSLQRIVYIPEQDVMYLSGYTPTKTEEHWGIVGKVLARYNNWSTGNRTPVWTMDIPHNTTNNFKGIMKTMAIEGEYIFFGGVETRGEVKVFRTSNGSSVGSLMPTSEVGGVDQTGWVDMPYAITAFKRSNGEYLVFLEEDAKAKVLMYRWNPNLGSGTGLKGEYFANTALTTLVKTQVDPTVNFEWGTGSPKNLDGTMMSSVGPDNFGVRWTGEIQAAEGGSYTFSVIADDTAKLWINNLTTPIINQAAYNNGNPKSATFSMTAKQKYAIKLEHTDTGGSANMKFSWTRPGQASAIVPQTQFYPPAS